MKRHNYFLVALALVSASSSAKEFSRSDFLGVSCASEDGGKTCYGYGERYENGTEDACGRVPNGGPEFALKLTYEISGPMVCSTVIATSDSRGMKIGESFCSIYLKKTDNGIQYRFTDDDLNKVREGYKAKRPDKWCQSLIDAL